MADPAISLQPVDVSLVLKDKVYVALKDAIAAMDIYAEPTAPKLDERQLAEQLGVSRTPVREALARLEQEGFVKMVARRGAFVMRKTKREILEMIHVWAALEGMAARMITEHASDEEISRLREMFATFADDGQIRAHIDEYSDTNIKFHQALISLCRCTLIKEMTDNLFLHMRTIRTRTIGERDRAAQSIIDHMHIIEALEKRDRDEAERAVRDHSLELAKHVAQYADYLD
ncbi:MAG: GntR family transcriptional regulator [Gammaproteobacteria bacterium]|nr:GntR family transcriptional regulator [Gammaproteobacteria bacterium]